MPVVLAALALVAAAAAPIARAHGDPITDTLQVSEIYFPRESNVTDELVRRLTDEVKRADEAGYRVKVALVDAPSDLGPRSAFFGKPGLLAGYVARDLESYFSGSVLVVMPSGFGLSPGDRQRRLASLPIGAGGNGLAVAATEAVRLLAGDSEPPGGDGGGSSAWRDRLAIAGAVLGAILLVVAVRVGRNRRARDAAA